jgi:hypothetical protein
VKSRKILSGAYGLAIVCAAIWLEAHGLKLQSQIFSLTAIAMVAPVGVADVSKGFLQAWFWIALLCCATLHTLFLWQIKAQLPFRTLGIAIMWGLAECLVMILVSVKVLDLYNKYG